MQKKEKRKRNCNQKHFYLDWNHTWQKSQKTGHPVSATGRHSLLPRPEERNFQWEPERSSGLFHQERRGGGGGVTQKGEIQSYLKGEGSISKQYILKGSQTRKESILTISSWEGIQWLLENLALATYEGKLGKGDRRPVLFYAESWQARLGQPSHLPLSPIKHTQTQTPIPHMHTHASTVTLRVALTCCANCLTEQFARGVGSTAWQVVSSMSSSIS